MIAVYRCQKFGKKGLGNSLNQFYVPFLIILFYYINILCFYFNKSKIKDENPPLFLLNINIKGIDMMHMPPVPNESKQRKAYLY